MEIQWLSCVFPLLSFHSDSGYAPQELAISWVFYKRKQATLDRSQAENLRLCSQRNSKHLDRMCSFPFFEINTLQK